MESLINNIDLSDIINASIFIGIIFCSLVNLTHSLEVYLLNKAWRVKDYEEIIYENIGTWDYVYNETQKKELVAQAINNHRKYIERKEKREKFLNKFKKNK